MYLSLNGRIITKEQARISPFDHGFMYGLGVFETFRTYGGHPFLFDDHLSRLAKGIGELNIHYPIDKEALLKEMSSLSLKNGLDDSYIRLNISAGIGEIGLQTEPYDKPEIIIFQKELPAYQPLREKEGKVLNIRRNTPETEERLKSHHYLNNIAARRELGQAGNAEGIFLTKEGFVAEGITSNIFWMKEGTLFTPSIHTGILNGITRQYILSLAVHLGIRTEEGHYEVDDVLGAEEVFFTNSVQEIIPASRIEEVYFLGSKGPVVQVLHQLYKSHSRSLWSRKEVIDLGGQA